MAERSAFDTIPTVQPIDVRSGQLWLDPSRVQPALMRRASDGRWITLGLIDPASFLPPRDHNNPPPDMLIDAATLSRETIELIARADALVESSTKAKAEDDETTAKCVALAKMLGDHAALVDEAREKRKRPFLDATRLIDGHFKVIHSSCIKAKDVVVGLIDIRRRRLDEAAQRQRRHDQQQAEAARATAEAARKTAEATAAFTGKPSIAAEVEATAATQRADVLQRRADTAAPVQIDSGLGAKAFGRKETTHEITDAIAFATWMLQTNKATLIESLHKLAKPFVGKVAEIPGVKVTTGTKTQVR